MALLQGARERRDGDAHACQAVVGIAILDDGDKTEVGQREVHVDVLVYLPVGELGETVEVLIGGVDQVKELTAIASLEHVFLSKFAHVQIVALLYHPGYLGVLLGYGFGHFQVVLHVVVVLTPASQALHVLVGVVIDGGHGAQLVKAEGKHALGIHVGKA